MKELKTLTEYQLLKLASHSLLERMAREEEVNVRTKKSLGEIIIFVKTDSKCTMSRWTK